MTHPPQDPNEGPPRHEPNVAPQQPPPPAYPPQQHPAQPPRKSRTWLWILLGVGALLVIGCIICAVWMGGGDNPPDPGDPGPYDQRMSAYLA